MASMGGFAGEDMSSGKPAESRPWTEHLRDAEISTRENIAAADIAAIVANDLGVLHPAWVVNAAGPVVVVIEPGETSIGRASGVGDVHVIEIHTIKRSHPD